MKNRTVAKNHHIAKIKKGKRGEISKIQEELDELKDAVVQDDPALIKHELSDVFGALRSYALKYNLKMRDLHELNKVTRRRKGIP